MQAARSVCSWQVEQSSQLTCAGTGTAKQAWVAREGRRQGESLQMPTSVGICSA